MLLMDAFERWRTARARRELTAKRYRAAVERLSRWWDLADTADVTAERVRAIQAEMLDAGSEHAYVRAEMSALRAVLADLEDAGLFPTGTLAELRKVALVPERRRLRRVRHLSREEFAALADAAERFEPYVDLPVRVATLLGPRTGELARMRAEDRHGGSVTIFSLPEFGEYGTCKTGPRVVPVCADLGKLLDTRFARTGWLFPARSRRTDRPFLSRDTLEDALQRVRRRAGLADDITFTVLRHTRASWWLQGGASLYKVADWLGHDFATCEEYYGSLVDGYDADCERMPA